MWRTGNHHTLLVGTQIGSTLWKNSIEAPQKIKNRVIKLSSNSTPRYVYKNPQKTKKKQRAKRKQKFEKIHGTPIFIAALFTIAKIWKPPKYP